MALRVNTNVAAINAHRNLQGTERFMNKNMQRLSSGYRINSAADDAAGLSIANKFRSDTRSLKVASRNVSQAKAMVNVAEGSANKIEEVVERLKELATQSASDTVSSTERTKINNEAKSLTDEITRIVNDTEYQGRKLLDGTASAATFQVGSSNAASTDTITVSFGDLTLSTLVIDDVDLTTQADASTALASLDGALASVNVALGDMGAAINRLDYTYDNLQVTIENYSASESVIRDVDMAAEMVGFTRNQILLQAGTAMLGQANMSSQGVLSLIG